MTKYSRLVLVNDTNDEWSVENDTSNSSNKTINIDNIDNTGFATLAANTRHLYSASTNMVVHGDTTNTITTNPGAIAVLYLSQTLKDFGTITVNEASTVEDTTDAYLAEQYAGFVLRCIGNDDSGMITNLTNVNHRTIIDYGGSELKYDGISDTIFQAEYKGGSGTITITNTNVKLEPLITTVPLPRIIMDMNGHVDVTACDNTSSSTTITYNTTDSVGITDISFPDNTGNAGSIIATNCPNLKTVTISAVKDYSTTSVYLDNCPQVTGLTFSVSNPCTFKSVGDLTFKNCEKLIDIFSNCIFYTTKQCNIVVDNCPSLTSIGSIQGTPATITGNGVTNGGLGANIEVSNCPLLETIGDHQPGQSDYVVNSDNNVIFGISECNSVCYADGYYVVVGNDSGTGVYAIGSMNADNIISCSAANSITGITSLNSVCYANGYFVAVGSVTVESEAGKSSSTGVYAIGTMNPNTEINWSNGMKIPGATSLNSVCYANGYFVAVGSVTVESDNIGICATGTVNGGTIDWTVTKINGIASIDSVCCGNGHFVAVGNNCDSSAIGLYTIGSIGITGHVIWNETATQVASDNLISVCFANGYFVAISAQKYYTGTVSTDGTVKWSEGNELQKSNTYNSICYGSGYLLISGFNDSMIGHISADGKITLRSEASIPGNEACYGNGCFIIVGAGGYTTIQLQTQSLTGTTASGDTGVTNLYSVCYGEGYYVAVSSNDGTGDTNNYAIGTMNSDGTMTWKPGQISGISNLQSVCYGDGYFVAVSSNNDYVIGTVNPDGISMTWATGTISSISNLWSVCYGNGYFVVVNDSSTNNYAIGTVNSDGISMTWATGTISSISNLWSVCYGNGYFVIIGYSSYAVGSMNDGTMTWTPGTISGIGRLRSVCYGNGYFVAISDNGINNYAIGTVNSDGISMTWTIGTINDIGELQSVCYDKGYFVAVDNANSNYAIGNVNSDGSMSWTVRQIEDISNLQSVCYGDGYFVTVGTSGDYVTIQLQDTNASVNTSITNCPKITDLGASNSPPSTSYLGYYIDSDPQSFAIPTSVKDNYIFVSNLTDDTLCYGPDIHHLTSTGQKATKIATSIPGYVVIYDDINYYYASFSNGILGTFTELTGVAGKLYEGCNAVYAINADNKTIYVIGIGIGTNGKPGKLYELSSASDLSSLILNGTICTYKNKIYNISENLISIYTLNASNGLDYNSVENLDIQGIISYASASSEYLVVCTTSNLYVFPITDSEISDTSLLSLSGEYYSALYLRNHKFIAFTDSAVMVVNATSNKLTATNQMSISDSISGLCRYGEFGVIGYNINSINIYTFTVKGAVNKPVIRITGTNPEYKQLAIKSWAGESMFGQTEPIDLQYSRIRSGTGIDIQSTYYTDNDGLLNLQSTAYSESDKLIIALIEALDANAKIQFHPNNRITFTAKNNYGEFIGCTLTDGTLTITNGRFIYNNIQYYTDDDLTVNNFSIQSKYPISITGNGTIDQSWFTNPITLRTNGTINDSLISLKQNQYINENNNLFVNTTASQIIYSSSTIKEPVTEPVTENIHTRDTDTFVVNPIPSRNLETPPIMQAM